MSVIGLEGDLTDASRLLKIVCIDEMAKITFEDDTGTYPRTSRAIGRMRAR